MVILEAYYFLYGGNLGYRTGSRLANCYKIVFVLNQEWKNFHPKHSYVKILLTAWLLYERRLSSAYRKYDKGKDKKKDVLTAMYALVPLIICTDLWS
jgi:hypothetical protein